MTDQQNFNSFGSEKSITSQEPGRSTLILILGILSIIFFGPFTGIPAWVMGNKDLKKIDDGIIPISEQSSTKTGKILGIIGTFFSGFFLIITGIAVVVGINIFTSSAVSANKDAISSDLMNLGSMAQQFYRKPASLGGGGNTFDGSEVIKTMKNEGTVINFQWDIPRSLKETANGTYKVTSIASQSVTIVGTGYEKGANGNPISVTATVTPTNIITSVTNP